MTESIAATILDGIMFWILTENCVRITWSLKLLKPYDYTPAMGNLYRVYTFLLLGGFSVKTVDLWFGRYESEWTLFHVLSIEFEIEPKVYSMDAFSSFLQNNGDFFINIRYWDLPYGAAAERLSEILQLFETIKAVKGPEYLDYAFIPREEVLLDFRECKSIFSVYEEMRKKMDWQDWYGNNLDALWDILTGLPYRGDDFVILRPRHYHGIPYGQDVFFTSRVDKICKIFIEAQEKYGAITVQIKYSETQ